MPFEEVVRLGEPDFPFCLAWANHSWEKKQWSGTTTEHFSMEKRNVLMEQRYEGKDDYEGYGSIQYKQYEPQIDLRENLA